MPKYLDELKDIEGMENVTIGTLESTENDPIELDEEN